MATKGAADAGSRAAAAAAAEDSKIAALYAALVRAILARDLTPGTKLSEETIGSTFGVNRNVVRAALNRMHSEALVTIFRNRGAFVASPTPREAREVLDLRVVIEREIAGRLAARITPPQIRLLEQNIAMHRQSYRAGDDAATVSAAEEFHLIGAGMVGNAVMEAALARLINRTALIMALYAHRSNSERGIDGHQAIVDAYKRHDAAEAQAAMSAHIAYLVGRTSLDADEPAKPALADILSRYKAG